MLCLPSSGSKSARPQRAVPVLQPPSLPPTTMRIDGRAIDPPTQWMPASSSLAQRPAVWRPHGGASASPPPGPRSRHGGGGPPHGGAPSSSSNDWPLPGAHLAKHWDALNFPTQVALGSTAAIVLCSCLCCFAVVCLRVRAWLHHRQYRIVVNNHLDVFEPDAFERAGSDVELASPPPYSGRS